MGTFLQLNYSHCNFSTKIEELRITVFENRADIVVISESNYDTEDEEVKRLREVKFPDFQFVDKLTAGNKVARLTVMVANDLKFETLTDFEDQENPMVTLKFREKKGKHLAVTALYRQWKAPGEKDSNNAAGIARQCCRMRKMNEHLEGIARAGFDMLVCGDYNIDRHPPNDPNSRPEIRALSPLLEDIMIATNLHQLNFKPTRHQIPC